MCSSRCTDDLQLYKKKKLFFFFNFVAVCSDGGFFFFSLPCHSLFFFLVMDTYKDTDEEIARVQGGRAKMAQRSYFF